MNVIAHKDREHSRYSASAAERWMNCPGSVRLCDGVPEQRSKYAEEGTQAHELLEAMLLDRQLGTTGAALKKQEILEKYAAGALLKDPEDTPERALQKMLDAVTIAFEYVCAVLDAIPDYGLTLEKRFTLPSEAAPGEVFGTADITIYDPTLRKLWVLDYKHGSGVAVDAIGSKQLRFYALGALQQQPTRPIETVEMVIMQPRAFHAAGPIRSEVIDACELVDFFDDIEEAIEEAQEATELYLLGGAGWAGFFLRPGKKTCQWCPAETICPARERQALALANESFRDVRQVTPQTLPAPMDLTPDRIGQILAMKDIVVDWLKAVETRGIELAKQGVFIPGRKLVEPVGRRSYNDPSMVAAKMQAVIGGHESEFYEPPTPLGVTAMEAKIKQLTPAKSPERKAALDAFALLTTKKSSGNLTLVAEDDPRPAVNAAQTAFADVTIPQIQMQQ